MDAYKLTVVITAGGEGESPSAVATIAPIDSESLTCPLMILVLKTRHWHGLLTNRWWFDASESTIPPGMQVPCQVRSCPRSEES